MTETNKQNIAARVKYLQAAFGYGKSVHQRSECAKRNMARAFRRKEHKNKACRVAAIRKSHAHRKRKGTWLRSCDKAVADR